MQIKYQQKPDLIAADMDGETVMLSVATGKYFALGGIAQFIWGMIADPESLEDVVDAVSARYKVDPAQAHADCSAFIDDLVRKDLVRTT